MKKVLILGASFYQLPAIIQAKKLGYHVVTCDYLPNNPGHKISDESYNVSTTDKEAVLDLAKKVNIDGVVSYATDQSAETAAYVSEKLGFPSNSVNAVKTLTNKDLFKQHLKNNNFSVPNINWFSSEEEAVSGMSTLRLPVMVKPVDASGSKGVSKVNNNEEIEHAVNNAFSYSRNKRIIVEEFIEQDGFLIGGDGFIIDGELVFSCLINQHNDNEAPNVYAPIAESVPYIDKNGMKNLVRDELEKLVKSLNLKVGSINFDIMINKEGKIFLIDVGPRNGGNLIPKVIELATGIDLTSYCIRCAMNEQNVVLDQVEPVGYWASYFIHSNDISGVFKGTEISEQISNNIIEQQYVKQPGDNVPALINSDGILASLLLKFNSEDEMLSKLDKMNDYAKPIIV